MVSKNNFNNVKKIFDKAAKNGVEGQYNTARQIILSTFKYIVQVSPVDKGTYRNSHRIIVGDSPFKVSDKQATVALKKLRPGNGVRQRCFIVNSVPYAWALEQGHSKQAIDGVYKPARDRALRLWLRFKNG